MGVGGEFGSGWRDFGEVKVEERGRGREVGESGCLTGACVVF